MEMQTTEYEVEFHHLGPGSIWICVPALPGCTAIACDREQALEEARSVIEQWLGFLRSVDDPIPDPNTKQNPERVRVTVTVPKPRRFVDSR
jgi:predicted RNase H-like HicB family nuclease